MVRLRKLVPIGAALLGALLFLGSPPTASADYTLVIQEYDQNGNQVGASQSFNGNTSNGRLSTGDVNTANFSVNVKASETAYLTGANPFLHTDVFTIAATNNTSDYLRVFLTNTGFTAPSGPVLTLVNQLSSVSFGPSNTLPSVTMQSAVDLNNLAFGVPNGTLVPPSGSNHAPLVYDSPHAYATDMVTGNADSRVTSTTSFTGVSGPISLTNFITVSGLASNDSVSFNATTTVTPAPGALVLLVSGVPFLAVGGWLRRRGRKSAVGRP